MPARTLEIYKEGIIYKTLWRTRTWHWSDFGGVCYAAYRSRYSYWQRSLVISNTRGIEIKLNGLSKWSEAQKQILAYAVPIIYDRAKETVDAGQYFSAMPNVEVGRSGMLYKEQYIDWQNVEYVRYEGGSVVIKSSLIDNLTHRLRFDRELTRNALIYAVLIHQLWQNALEAAPPVGDVEVVINGIGFNSEGEIIAYDHESIKFKEERI